MVGDDDYWVLCPSEVVGPFFQGLDDSEEFSVIDVIVLLDWREHSRVICTGVEIPV